MRSLLVAGAFQGVLKGYGLDIVNRSNLNLEDILPCLRQEQPGYDQIVIMDDGMLEYDAYSISAILKSLLLYLEQEGEKQPVTLITTNVLAMDINIAGITVKSYYSQRITISSLLDLIRGNNQENGKKSGGRLSKGRAPTNGQLNAEEGKPVTKTAKHSLLERMKKDKAAFAPVAVYKEKEFAGLSGEISRVIAISGCRGSGVTSTAVNLAQLACKKGLSTMLVDLDTLNCALNLYFNGFYEEAATDLDIACSLMRNLAKPQDYKLNSYNNGCLYMTTLAYSFREKELLERFYNSAKLVNMLAVFRKHFQLCLLDMPLELLAVFREAILYIDAFGLTVPNNLYSLTGLLRNTQNLLSAEEMASLYSKSKIIVAKYNDRSTIQDEPFAPQMVCELLKELSEESCDEEFELAGFIPYTMDFDEQLETDVAIVNNNSQMEKAYTDILLRMIKGV